MANKKYTDKHIEYLRVITPGRYDMEITKLFNKRFGMDVTVTAIKSLKSRHKIRSNVPPGGMIRYEKEHIDYLRELADKGLFNEEIMEKFNKKFGTNKKVYAIRSIKAKHGIKTSARNWWPKEHVPWNKGMKGLAIGGEETQFKKGSVPPNTLEVGAEVTDSDGYAKIKMAEPNIWEHKHRLVYKEHHGEIPEGHAIIFGDGDRTNFDIDNLICVSRKQLLKLNQHDLIKNDADLTRTGILIADIILKAGERKRNK